MIPAENGVGLEIELYHRVNQIPHIDVLIIEYKFHSGLTILPCLFLHRSQIYTTGDTIIITWPLDCSVVEGSNHSIHLNPGSECQQVHKFHILYYILTKGFVGNDGLYDFLDQKLCS